MARVALVNLGSLPMPGNEPIFPIGLRCVQDALDRAGHHTELLDFVADPHLAEDLSWAAKPWDVIGFSIRNIDPIDLARDGHVDDYARFVERVRAASGTNAPLLVGGGPGYSLFGEALRERLALDVGVVGPGERSMLRIVDDVAAYRGARRNLAGERHPGFTSDILHHPSRLMAAYTMVPEPSIGIETRRKTCYQECVYCPYAHISGDNSGDLKPLENIAEEVRKVYDAGIRRVFFTDPIFNSELRFAKQVVRTITELRLPDLRWSAYFTPKPFDDEFAEMLPVSNIEQVVVSPDSLDPGMMHVLGKRFDLRHVGRMTERCRRNGVKLKMIVVFGGPGESRETVRSSARYANEHFTSDELLIFVGFRVLPGTGLARQMGLPDAELLSPTFYPFDPELFSWILEDFDTRFFTTGRLIHMMAARNAAKHMERLPGGAAQTAARMELPLMALRRTGQGTR